MPQLQRKRVTMPPAVHYGRVTSIDEEKRTVDVLLNSGAPMLRGGGWSEPYELELSMERGHTRLDRLKSGRMPMLEDHGMTGFMSDRSSLDTVLGVFVTGKITPEGLLTTVRFDTGELAERRFQSCKAGVLCNFSAGVFLHKLKEVTPEGASRKRFRAIDWEPFEGSLVAVGADHGAAALSAGDPATEALSTALCARLSAAGYAAECEIESETTETDMDREKLIRAAVKKAGLAEEFAQTLIDDKVELEAAIERIAEELAKRPAPAKPAPARTEPASADPAALRNEGAAAERERAKEIRAAAKKAGLSDEFASGLVDEGLTVDLARARIIDELAAASDRQDEGGHTGRQTATVGKDARQKFAPLATSALLNRFRPDLFQLAPGAEQFRGATLIDLARESLEAAGRRTRGMGRHDIAKLAMQTTSDFPAIVADVSNNTLRRGYEESPRTWEPITTVGSAVDFKSINRTQMSAAPGLDEVTEHGEFTHGKLLDGKESYVVGSYGKIVALTRKAIINDSLDAFTRIPMMFGQSAARKQADVAWGLINTNGDMADGEALFSAAHANLGAQTLTDHTDLQELVNKIQLQRGLQGEQLSLKAMWLIVPVALQMKALQLTATIAANEQVKVNPYASMLQVIAEPRLDSTSQAAWYLAASKAMVDMLEVSYLDGVQVPRIETEVGFEVDGIQIKCAFDFGFGVIDFRGLAKSTGATA